MSKKGGYQVIDFGNVEYENGSQYSLPFVRDAIDVSTNKPILISGLNIDGVLYPDSFVEIKHESTGIYFLIGMLKVTFTEDVMQADSYEPFSPATRESYGTVMQMECVYKLSEEDPHTTAEIVEWVNSILTNLTSAGIMEEEI